MPLKHFYQFLTARKVGGEGEVINIRQHILKCDKNLPFFKGNTYANNDSFETVFSEFKTVFPKISKIKMKIKKSSLVSCTADDAYEEFQ